MTILLRTLISAVAIFGLAGCVSIVDDLGVAAGYYSISYVQTESVPESEVMRVFQDFAKVEKFSCGLVLNERQVLSSCVRTDGIYLFVWRETGRVKFISEAPYGLRGSDSLKSFNARLANFLRGHFKDAVESDS